MNREGFELASSLILHVYLPKYEGGGKHEVRGRFWVIKMATHMYERPFLILIQDVYKSDSPYCAGIITTSSTLPCCVNERSAFCTDSALNASTEAL